MRFIEEGAVYALFDKSGRASLHVGDIDVLPRAFVQRRSRMKFVIDEMPFWESDCPFYEDGKCKLDGHRCVYMSYPAGHRDPEDCEWLVVKGEE